MTRLVEQETELMEPRIERSDATETNPSQKSEALLTGDRWARLVARIQREEPEGMEELYRTFSRGIRFYLCKRVAPSELDDRVHDAFVIVVQAIRNGSLRQPDRLMGFVRTVVRRQVVASIEEAVQQRRDLMDLEMGHGVADSRQDPETAALREERIGLMVDVLRSISKRDREILTRFYIEEQTPEEICRRMALTETQFRLFKSRAKAKFGEIGRRRVGKSFIGSLLMRKAAGQ